MTRTEKLVEKLLQRQSEITWKELVKVLGYYGFEEVKNKGKTAGSRRKFVNDQKVIINLHEPHPEPVVKEYVVKQIIQKLKLEQK